MTKRTALAAAAAAMLAPAAATAELYGDTPDAKHAWAVHDWNRPKPHRVTPAATLGGAPSDAVVLFDGSKESLDRNWCNPAGEPTGWKHSAEGFFYCEPGRKNGGNIRTREKFGDCQLHIEFRHEPSSVSGKRGPQMRGNSGVFLMGMYEIQVLESYHTCAEDCSVDNYTDGQAAAVYAENPPMVNPARKPGEWQVYDIVFHQPIWEGAKLLHPGSVTVFFNGVLVQDHWEMEGLTTHCKRRPLAPHETKGALSLQDHGCLVQYRNVWLRPLASRWANTTHSTMSGVEADVMALRRKTAAALYAKIAEPRKPTAANVKALAEVVSYANEGKYAEDFKACLEAYRAAPGPAKEVDSVNKSLAVLARNFPKESAPAPVAKKR